MGKPGSHRAACRLNCRSRVLGVAAALLVLCLGAIAPAHAADSIAGAADLTATKTFVLLAVSYLKDGRPFGSTDYGLRVPKTFCLVQKETLLDRWVSEGNPRMGTDTVWLTQRDYAVKLFCVDIKDYDNRSFRLRLLKKPLGN